MIGQHAPRWYKGTTAERIDFAPGRVAAFWFDTTDSGLYWWDGTKWNSLVPSDGVYFLHEDDDPVIAGYEQLLSTPTGGAEVSDSVVCVNTNTEYVIDEYITPAGVPGLDIIPGGAWHFSTFCSVDSGTGDTRIVIRVYKRAVGGAETELFNVTSDEINDTTVALHEFDVVEPDFIVDPTDRLLVKYFAKTTSVPDRTVTLYYEGTAHYTHIHTPIITGGGGVGASSFLDLTDTPATYTGQAGMHVAVNITEDALEFTSTSGGGHVIEDSETPLTQRSKLSFDGDGVVVTDDGAGDRTVVTVASPTGGADYFAHIDGALSTDTDVNRFVIARPCTIDIVMITALVQGTANSTIVDVHLNGTTIFTTQANRPTLMWNDGDGVASGTPDIRDLMTGDVLSIDIDDVATDSSGLSVTITVTGGIAGGDIIIGGGGHAIKEEGGAALPQRANLNFVGALITATDDAGNDATIITVAASAPTFQAIFTIVGTLAVGAGAIRIYNVTGVTKTISKVFISVGTVPTGAAIIVDVNKDGTTIFTNQANRPQIAASANVGQTTTIDVASWADGTYLTADVDQIGSTQAGSNLTIHIVYT